MGRCRHGPGTASAQLALLTEATALAEIVLLAESRDILSNLLANAKAFKIKQVAKEKAAGEAMLKVWKQAFEALGEAFAKLWQEAFGGKDAEEVLGTPGGKQNVAKFLQSKQLADLVGQVVSMAADATEQVTAQAAVDQAYLAKGYGEADLGVLWSKDVEVAAKIGAGNFTYVDPVATSKDSIGQAIKDAKKLSDFVRKEVVAQLEEGALLGDGIPAMRRRLAGLEGVSKNRADILSRYAMIRSYNATRQAQYEAANQSLGGLLKKVWVATMDGRVCPYCLALHGHVVEVTEVFPDDLSYTDKKAGFFGDKMVPPRHPRCRCTVIPFMERWVTGMVKTPEGMLKEAADHAEALGYTGDDQEERTAFKLKAAVGQAQALAAKLDFDRLDVGRVEGVLSKLKPLAEIGYMPSDVVASAQSSIKQFEAWRGIAATKQLILDSSKANSEHGLAEALQQAQAVAGAKKGYNYRQKAAAKQAAAKAKMLLDAVQKLKVS